MEIDRLVVFLVIGFAVVFPEQGVYLALFALVFEVFARYRKSKSLESCDKQSLELLFHLGAVKNITEQTVAQEMKGFPCFQKFTDVFERTSKLNLPNFRWRSLIVNNAIQSALDTGNTSIITKALEQVSNRENAIVESQSMVAAQKYTLIASIAVSSSILGVASSISGQNYFYYVIAQSILSAIWLKFIGNNLYESLSISIPLSVVGYLSAIKFV